MPVSHLPISKEGVTWKNWVGVQPVWLEQHQILKQFKKPKLTPEYPKRLSIVTGYYHKRTKGSEKQSESSIA
jgi:hypothetical protein